MGIFRQKVCCKILLSSFNWIFSFSRFSGKTTNNFSETRQIHELLTHTLNYGPWSITQKSAMPLFSMWDDGTLLCLLLPPQVQKIFFITFTRPWAQEIGWLQFRYEHHIIQIEIDLKLSIYIELIFWDWTLSWFQSNVVLDVRRQLISWVLEKLNQP